MSITITTLIENNPSADPNLHYEHGLSLFIELPDCNILFDTGQSGDFIENAAYLNKDLMKTDYLLISHGHYDHSRGMLKVLENQILGSNTKMYVGAGFFQPKYKKTEDGFFATRGNMFGKEDVLNAGIQVTEVEGKITNLSDSVLVFRHFPRTNPFEQLNPHFYIYKDNQYEVDPFEDEIALGIKTKKGLVLIVGCSHIGIVNILTEVKKRIDMPIYMVIGGTHLVEADEERIVNTITALKEFGIQKIAVSHCTGQETIERLRESFQDGFVYNNTGNVISLD